MRHLITLTLFTTAFSLSAQLQNGGFEALDTLGMPNYWSPGIGLIPIGDSIVFDGARYLLNTTDVHGGSNAIELRNAYDFTLNAGLPGSWFASPFQESYGGFLSPDVPLVQRPGSVHCWLDYSPVGGDSGYVSVQVTNEWMEGIGAGTLHVGGTAGGYVEFEIPIIYSSTDSAAFIGIEFVTIVPGSNASLGTRMLIDDVSIEYTTTGIAENDVEAFGLFPNPATDEVRLSGAWSGCNVRVLDAMGREAIATSAITDRLSVRQLQPGAYVVEAREGERVRQSRLVIAR